MLQRKQNYYYGIRWRTDYKLVAIFILVQKSYLNPQHYLQKLDAQTLPRTILFKGSTVCIWKCVICVIKDLHPYDESKNKHLPLDPSNFGEYLDPLSLFKNNSIFGHYLGLNTMANQG